jgi:hypothetical protein
LPATPAAIVAASQAIIVSTAAPRSVTTPAITVTSTASDASAAPRFATGTAQAIAAASASGTVESAVAPTAAASRSSTSVAATASATSKSTSTTTSSAAAASAAHSARVETPAVGCCADHALARKVLFENEFGWFPVPAEFTVQPRPYHDYDGNTFLEWILWDYDEVCLAGPNNFYIIDSSDRVMLIGSFETLFWFWRSERTSRELNALLSCDYSGVQFPFADSKLVNAKMRSFGYDAVSAPRAVRY